MKDFYFSKEYHSIELEETENEAEIADSILINFFNGKYDEHCFNLNKEKSE